MYRVAGTDFWRVEHRCDSYIKYVVALLTLCGVAAALAYFQNVIRFVPSRHFESIMRMYIVRRQAPQNSRKYVAIINTDALSSFVVKHLSIVVKVSRMC